MSTSDAEKQSNWTADERALLQRTLCVRTFDDRRLEVEVPSPEWESLRHVLFGHGIVFWITGILTFLLTVVGPEGLEIKPSMACLLLSLNLFLSLLLSSAWAPDQLSSPVSLFSGTPWFIRHGALQNSLDQLKPASEAILDRQGRRRTIAFGSDVGGVWLQTKRSASEDDRSQCQALLLKRCALSAGKDEPPPLHVVSLIDDEVLRTPRPVYGLLRRHLNLMSLSSQTLVLRRGQVSPLVTVAVAAFDVSILLLIVLVPGWASAEVYWVVGPTGTARLWQLAMVVMSWSLTLVHTGLLMRYWHRRSMAQVTFRKHSDVVIRRDGRNEVSFPKCECTVSTGPDSWESDEIVDRASVFLCHRKKLVERWVLENCSSPEEAGKALVAKVREYIDGANIASAHEHPRC